MAQNGPTVSGKAKTYAVEAIRSPAELKELADYALDYAHTIGCIARHPEHKFDSQLAVPPPLALLPSPFPKEIFEQAQSVQTTLNELYFKIANDHKFLMDAYKDVVKGDPFTGKLVELARRIHNEGIHQPLMVELQRADYMSHQEPGKIQLKQVEVNPGQIGGPGAATATSKLHKKMLEKLEILHQGKLPSLANAVQPENRPKQRLAAVMYKAWKMFGDKNAVLVFINQPDLFPVCHFEQLQYIQFELQKIAKKEGNYVNVLCMSIKESVDRLRLDEKDFSLYVDGNKKVGLVHMAYGYLPEHYPTEAEYNTRVMMERSTAILSPNIRLQLSGTKKIQQLLAKPGVLERFFPTQPERIAKLRATFTELWGLETEDERTKAVMAKACENTKDFVLKNQMDGGHGNFFDEAIKQKLTTMSLDERSAYILQKKIYSIVSKNYFMRQFKEPKEEYVISEVGIYGSLIANQKSGEILHNDVDGHLCRSKPAEFNEGGVSGGGGVIDSVLLFPASDFQ